MMKTRLSTWVPAVVASLVVLAGGSRADANFVLRFDEDGHGSVSVDGGPATAASFVYGADPTGRVAGNVLTYLLPELVSGGDIRIWEDAAKTILSDVLAFTTISGPSGSQSVMVFYSLPGDGDLADSGLPAMLNPADSGGVVENADGSFIWLPGGNEYYGFSGNSVPEPSTLAMCGIAGLIGLAHAVRRRRAI